MENEHKDQQAVEIPVKILRPALELFAIVLVSAASGFTGSSYHASDFAFRIDAVQREINALSASGERAFAQRSKHVDEDIAELKGKLDRLEARCSDLTSQVGKLPPKELIRELAEIKIEVAYLKAEVYKIKER